MMSVWAVCFRLTFWELSWDVMEPITYFIGSGTGTKSYCLASLKGQLQQLFADLTYGAEVCWVPASLKKQLDTGTWLDRPVKERCCTCRHRLLFVLSDNTERICLPGMEKSDDDKLAGTRLTKLCSF